MRSFRTTAKEVFLMLQIKRQFQDSYMELKEVRTLVMTAMLIAVGIILGQFSIQVTETTKIGISFIATQLTAMLYGPVVGGIMGGVADILKFIIKPTGTFMIGYTISPILSSMIYGVMLYKKPIRLWRILAAKTVVAILINVLLGSFWNYLYMGKAFLAMLPVKMLQQVIQVPLQSILFYLVVQTLYKAKVFRTLGNS